MQPKRILVLVLALAAAGAVFADITEDVTSVFNDFLGRLSAKHEALENLAMPGMETRGDFITQAAVTLSFENPGEAKTFITALEAENIPFGSFPGEAGKVLLISIDMMIFVMQEAIGL
jgi:hypothetical protein